MTELRDLMSLLFMVSHTNATQCIQTQSLKTQRFHIEIVRNKKKVMRHCYFALNLKLIEHF